MTFFFSYSCKLKFFLLVHLLKHLSQSSLLFPGTNWEEIILYYPLKKPNKLTAVSMWNSQTSTKKDLTFVTRMWGPHSADVHFSGPKFPANSVSNCACCLVLEPLLLNCQCMVEEETADRAHGPKIELHLLSTPVCSWSKDLCAD